MAFTFVQSFLIFFQIKKNKFFKAGSGSNLHYKTAGSTLKRTAGSGPVK